jgi:hypothetical protein
MALGAAAVVGMGILYFNDPLPNTYYAKDMELSRAISQGAHYLLHSIEPQTGFRAGGLLLILQLALLCLGIYAVVRKLPRYGYLIAIVVAQSVFILKSGGDWMQGSRFAAPAVIPFILIEVLGLVVVTSSLRRHARPALTRGLCLVAAAGLLASSVSSSLLPDPVWQLSGVDDLSLVGAGHYAQSYLWATLPSYLKCLHPGQLVATSEVGYAGFVRQDLRILDIRGLTDRAIAKGAPASMKSQPGVADHSLLQPTSPVGRVLLSTRPALIATFDTLPQKTALGGAYKLVETPESLGISLYVPTSTQPVCLDAVAAN